MGGVYKKKKGRGCWICKPWKHGLAPKRKNKIAQKVNLMKKEVDEVIRKQQ